MKETKETTMKIKEALISKKSGVPVKIFVALSILAITGITGMIIFGIADLIPDILAIQHEIEKPIITLYQPSWDSTKSLYQGKGNVHTIKDTIHTVEYFINDQTHHPGAGVPLSHAPNEKFRMLQEHKFNFSIPSANLKVGDNMLCFDARTSKNVWSDTLCMTVTK